MSTSSLFSDRPQLVWRLLALPTASSPFLPLGEDLVVHYLYTGGGGAEKEAHSWQGRHMGLVSGDQSDSPSSDSTRHSTKAKLHCLLESLHFCIYRTGLKIIPAFSSNPMRIQWYIYHKCTSKNICMCTYNGVESLFRNTQECYYYNLKECLLCVRHHIRYFIYMISNS